MHIPLIPCSLRPLYIIVIGMCELIHKSLELVSIPHRHVACHLFIPLFLPPLTWAVPTAGIQDKPAAGDVCLPHQWTSHAHTAFNLSALTNHECSCSLTHRYSRLRSRTNWIRSHCYKERERKNRSMSRVAMFICQRVDWVFFRK